MAVDELVDAILEDGPGTGQANLRALLRAVSGPGRKIETARCDLKGQFEPTSSSWPDLVKDIVAMANSGGGVLVLGVDDNGARRGLSESRLHDLDPTRVNGKIEPKAPGARVGVSYHELTYYGRIYGFVAVEPHDALIVFDRDWAYSTASGRMKTVIHPGVVYVRGVAETRPARQGDLARIVQGLIDTGSQKFLARIEQLAAVPLSAELVAYDPVGGGRGVKLVSKGEGQPVTVVDEQPGAVPIHEVLSTEIPFSSVQAEFASQVRHWKTSDPNHRVRRETLESWYLRRDDLDLNDDMAEFAFLSAGDHHGFIMFWAAALSQGRLDAALSTELEKANYPMRQVLPYVVGAFYWSEKRALLEPYIDRFEGTRPIAERLIKARSFELFTKRGRYPGKRIRFGSDTYLVEALASDQGRARQLFEAMLSADQDGRLRDRGPAHQLDILLHARES